LLPKLLLSLRSSGMSLRSIPLSLRSSGTPYGRLLAFIVKSHTQVLSKALPKP
jgi:hypothetical protein